MIALSPRVTRKRTETDVVKSCLSAIGKIRGVRGARNNVGCLKDERGIPVTYGLGTGSPDIVGLVTIGGVNSAVDSLRHLRPRAFAFAIEVKRPVEEGGKAPTPAQKTWAKAAGRRGCWSGLARTPDEAVRFVLSLIVSIADDLQGLAR
jgi:hypothetical protein